jgi:hypothetical protein
MALPFAGEEAVDVFDAEESAVAAEHFAPEGVAVAFEGLGGDVGAGVEVGFRVVVAGEDDDAALGGRGGGAGDAFRVFGVERLLLFGDGEDEGLVGFGGGAILLRSHSARKG